MYTDLQLFLEIYKNIYKLIFYERGIIMSSTAFLTTEMVQPIVTAVQDNLEVLLPVGIGIFAVMIGVSLLPRIIYKFL